MSPRDDDAVADDSLDRGVGQRVVRNYVVSLVRLVVGQMLGLVVFVVLSRRGAPTDYALYSGIAISVPTAYHLLAGPLTTVVSRGDSPPSRSALNGLAYALAVTGLTLLATTAVISGGTLRQPALVVGIAVYVIAIATYFPAHALLWRNVRTGSQALLDLFDRASFQGVTILLVLAGFAMDTAVGVGMGVAGLVYAFVARLMVAWRPGRGDVGAARALARRSVAPFLALAAVSLIDGFLVPLTALLAGSTQAGLFGWAFSLATIPLGFVSTAIYSMQPAFARMAANQVRDAAIRSTRLIGCLAAWLAAIVAVGMAHLVELGLGQVWTDALPVLWTLLAGVVLHGSTNVLISLWNARNPLAEVARWQVMAYATAFGVSIPAVAFGGALGAAASYALARLLLAVPLAHVARRRYEIPLGRIAASCLASAFVAVSIALVLVPPSASWAAAAIGTGIALLGTPALLVLAIGPAVRGDILTAWSLLRSRAVKNDQQAM